MYNMGIEVVHITADGKEIDGTTEISKTPGVKTNPNEVSTLFNNGTPMFVEFYANWCGHCKTLAPEWKKLIKMIEVPEYEDKKLAIVSVESEAINKDIEKVIEQSGLGKVEGFPTIGLIKGKKFVSYNGKRDAASMLKFIKEKAGSIMGGGGRRSTRKHKRSSTKHKRKRSSNRNLNKNRKSTKRKSINSRRRKY